MKNNFLKIIKIKNSNNMKTNTLEIETKPVKQPEIKPIAEPDRKNEPILPLKPPAPKIIPVPKN
jgi:hypothetical protein